LTTAIQFAILSYKLIKQKEGKMRNFNSRDEALDLVENGIVSAEAMLTMALKYMSTDDVADMLDCNELSDRFMEDEDDGQPDWAQEWSDFDPEC
tara:strand:- start:397 stop:678 length:282 start_codon:yes stop_codon:yes gene_type:complete